MVWAALSAIYVVWGSTYLAIRVAVETLPPLLMASVRFLVAGAALYAWSIRRGDREGDRPGPAQWRAATIVGGLLLLGGNGGVVLAEQHIPSGVAALLVATVPLWMVLIGRVAYRERTTVQELVGVVMGFGGLVLLAGLPGPGSFHAFGTSAIIFAALSWAVGSMYARKAPLPARPLVSTAMQMLAGGVLLGLAGIVAGEIGDVELARVSLRSVLGLAYLIVFGSWVGFTAYAWLLRVARTSLVATYAYVNPVVAVFLGWMILDERINAATVVAGLVIVVAVALIVTARSGGSGARRWALPRPAVWASRLRSGRARTRPSRP
jgi:drug/metabolite transporter (DMT)-like permease